MNIALFEPYYGGSHQQWADGLRRHSRHRVQLFTLPPRHWKWRMHGAAVTLSEAWNRRNEPADLLLATDLLDLAAFRGLLQSPHRTTPLALYFHENQLTYPWSPGDPDPGLQRDRHYAFINYTSALTADRIFFNSDFHRRAFLDALPEFLRRFPDHRTLHRVAEIREKSRTLPLALSLSELEAAPAATPPPEEAVLLWNHRWEYDKGPEVFFRLLFRLAAEGVPFKLVVLGASYREAPPIFAQARAALAGHLLHWGYAEDRKAYAAWLQLADILPVTSRQDFFGASVVEALYCNCYPLLPNRLAFPEHLPPALHDAHLYDGEEALYRKLVQAIRRRRQLRRGKGFRHFVERYDWRNLAGTYDRLLERASTINPSS